MRLHLPLNDILTSRARLAVLRALVLFPRKEFTGRELSRFAAVSLSQTQEALFTLGRAGLAERRSVGRSHQWRIVEQNALLPSLRGLFHAEQSTFATLRNELAVALKDQPVRAARVFGSVAQGRERIDSDLDIFVEVPDTRSEERVTQALQNVVVDLSRKYGVGVNPIVVTSSRKSRLNPNVIRDVEANGIPIDHSRTG